MKRRAFLIAAIATLVVACTSVSPDYELGKGPQDMFMATLRQHCGKAFEGQMVSTDPSDTDFASQRMVMHVRQCADDEVRIPFHVGENRSRTWIITRTEDGLRLKHDHRHEDGSPDDVTMYGGDTSDPGTASRQHFPVDDFSIAMFEREGLEQSVTNIWAMEVSSRHFAYELRRPSGRFFRVEFDLTKPIAPPPPPWGS